MAGVRLLDSIKTVTQENEWVGWIIGHMGTIFDPNNVNNMATCAERNLEFAHYTVESKRWKFEKYVKVHMDKYHIMMSVMEHGYSGIDERS